MISEARFIEAVREAVASLPPIVMISTCYHDFLYTWHWRTESKPYANFVTVTRVGTLVDITFLDGTVRRYMERESKRTPQKIIDGIDALLCETTKGWDCTTDERSGFARNYTPPKPTEGETPCE